LAPISFANKSIDLKESSSPSNKISESSDSLKFNTANITDLYSNTNTPSQTNNINKTSSNKSSLNNEQNKKIIKDSRNLNNEDNIEKISKYQFDSADYNTNNKYDDEFNEVILEEIQEVKNVFGKNKEDEVEDSKKIYYRKFCNQHSFFFWL
jgi:hypothetical protein